MIKLFNTNFKMKRNLLKITIFPLLLLLVFGCSSESNGYYPYSNGVNNPVPVVIPQTQAKEYNYLALGDSYTIGQSVCETCRFPEQLKKSLGNLNPINSYSLKIIAQTGWTTTNLISAINNQNPAPNYDLVTLLIGVNNQYRGRSTENYREEFSMLLKRAIAYAGKKTTHVFVLSILFL